MDPANDRRRERLVKDYLQEERGSFLAIQRLTRSVLVIVAIIVIVLIILK